MLQGKQNKCEGAVASENLSNMQKRSDWFMKSNLLQSVNLREGA